VFFTVGKRHGGLCSAPAMRPRIGPELEGTWWGLEGCTPGKSTATHRPSYHYRPSRKMGRCAGF